MPPSDVLYIPKSLLHFCSFLTPFKDYLVHISLEDNGVTTILTFHTPTGEYEPPLSRTS